jgi:hypothetical protein
MQHQEADQTLAVERYLLGDMTPSEVDQFEEHLFLCPKCAASVKTGTVFIENTRAVFKEPDLRAETETTRQPLERKPTPWWKGFMAPAFAPAVAALALLCVAGYQRLVVIQGLRAQLAAFTEPQLLPSFPLHAASRGSQQTIVVPARARFFNLYFDVAEESPSGYSCEVLDGLGSVRFKEQLVPSKSPGGGTMNLLVGRSRLPAGDYTLVVAAESPRAVEIGRYPFKIEFQ